MLEGDLIDLLDGEASGIASSVIEMVSDSMSTNVEPSDFREASKYVLGQIAEILLREAR